jgi:hypothetical protein
MFKLGYGSQSRVQLYYLLANYRRAEYQLSDGSGNSQLDRDGIMEGGAIV